MRLLWSFLFVFASFPVRADVYTVGVEYLEYYPAYNYIGHPDASASKDILDDFANKSGHQFKYVALPVSRLYEKFLDGTVDFKFPDHPDWQSGIKTGKAVLYSDPVFEYIDGLLVLDKAKLKNLADLKKIGSFRGFTIWDYKKDIDQKRIKVKSYDSVRQLVMAGLKGSVDGIYLNIKVAQHYLSQIQSEQQGIGSLEFQDRLPFTRSNYRLSSIQHGQVLQQFNQYLQDNAAFVQRAISKRK
ncbi:MAG: transporter substrate-binding domain-containing protein, partial [Pseudobdellovibrionaceae bacterium]|nr:transporter substrate-binding domain-containing protein [Pseudobdellovibrionaceae bacterium]